MDKLVIEGGVPTGGIDISGSKCGPAHSVRVHPFSEPAVIANVPDLRDIHTTLKLLNVLGCACGYDDHEVRTPYDLVRTMRASVLCLGPLLARIGQARVALPGGCAIGARPVDQHLKGLESMGASFQLEEGYILGRCRRLTGARITFDMPTVGGTENLLMAAALADGETLLENAAREPEVVDLANFLRACGAEIEGHGTDVIREGHGTDVIRIRGVQALHGASYAVMPDRIEAGSFLVAAGITGGELLLRHCPFDALEAVIRKLCDMGMEITATPQGVLARCAGPLHGTDVKTQPYPGFPTDMQAQIMALMCLADGASVVEESIFENRYMHVLELVRLGAQIKVSGHTAMVRGVQGLTGAPVMASDLRASASLVLAGLAAKGRTEVRRIYHLDRGYEHIEHKLTAVGARIRREQE